MATKKQIKSELKIAMGKPVKGYTEDRSTKDVSMMTRTPGVSARQAAKQEGKSKGKEWAMRRGDVKGENKVKRFVKDWFTLSPSEKAKFAKIRAASQLGTTSKGLGKFKKGEFDQPKRKATGGMVKSYATGGSVSRGQYPAQARKVKFKGVF